MNTYKSTRHAKFLINYHFVWVPKYRKNILKGEVADLVLKVIEETCVKYEFEIIAMEIMEDHVHLFLSALPRHSPSYIMNMIKGETGRAVSRNFPNLNESGSIWTPAYFVSSAGNISSEIVKKYIEEQYK